MSQPPHTPYLVSGKTNARVYVTSVLDEDNRVFIQVSTYNYDSQFITQLRSACGLEDDCKFLPDYWVVV